MALLTETEGQQTNSVVPPAGIQTQPGATMRARTRVSEGIDNRGAWATVAPVEGGNSPALVTAILEATGMPAIVVGLVVETASAIAASPAEVVLVTLAPLAGRDPAEAVHEPAVAAVRPAWEARVAVAADPGVVVAVEAAVVVAGGGS